MAKKTEVFNPVKEDTSGVQARRAIWSSKSLDMALEGIKQGRKLVANPFYENNTKLLKGDLVFDRTQDEIKEWLKCKNDIIYFVEKYCKLMTPEGIKNVKLREYQKNYLKHLEKHRLSIYLACRQCGKTTTSAVFMLHYILFNVDKNALVLGNKRKTAVEILDKAKKIYLELPYFLKPGIYKWNEGEIVLDNGCRLMAEATTINSGISFTFHCVLSDEFAHIQPNIIDKFYNNLFPTITAGKARFMITSTQNGYNLFYRLYKAAESGMNEYAPFKTDWYEVPEWNPETLSWDKRDEKWHQMQVANYGSEEAFNKQFGTNFDVSASLLISQKIIDKRRTRLVEFVEKIMPGVKHSSFWRWHPNFDPITCKNEYIVCTTDISEGCGGDYTVCKIHRLIFDDGQTKLECIGYFRSNSIAREETVLSIQQFISYMCDQEKILLSFERNTYGELFVNQLIDNYMKSVPGCTNFDPSCLVRYYNDSGTKFVYGIKVTSGNKSTHCLLYKEEYEKDTLINDCAEFMVELNNFQDDGNGKYKAAFGHDDMVMAEVQLTFVKETLQYKLFKEEFEANVDVQLPDNIYNSFEDMNMSPYQISSFDTWFNNMEDNLLNPNNPRLR
jgi:hypothetical protein